MRLPVYVSLLLAPLLASAETFTVDTSSDASLSACTPAPGDCSLRGALLRANANVDADVVAFALPPTDAGYQVASEHWQIAVGDFALPPILAPVLIDGYTQPGAGANTLTPVQGGLDGTLKIEIRGISQFRTQQNGLEIGGNEFNQAASTFRGLAINSFGAQLLLHGSSAHRVEGCYLGTDIAGQEAAVSSNFGRGLGVRIQGPGPYVIGGTAPATRNLLSGLAGAVANFAASDGVHIEGNLFGTNAAGNLPIGDTVDALNLLGPFTNARIGGSDAFARNVIAASHFSAIRMSSSGNDSFVGTRIEGNYFGTDVSGRLELGNGHNPQSPSQPQPTILVGGGPDCALEIGGLAPGQANLIANGGAAGLQVDNCTGTSSPLNRYRNNRGPAIDNVFGGGANGPTANDPGDADTGGNRLQNFAAVTLPGGFLPAGGAGVELDFVVDTAIAHASYPLRVDFYRADCGGGSRQFLGSTQVQAVDAQTPRSFTLASPDGGNVLPLTALAVDADGNSSEFAPVQGEAIFADGLEDQASTLTPGRCE
ncbi:MAG: hypothetical protein IT479_06495 [Xanthomonadales bacterium]|nr:hypothetical protein [Xanthomonadales bacterium]MCC6592908.1 hypothetical protein [Xanthomonadales bacterium]MCE7930763.1 hypothetical protein [Xanthomonadales bacterium PRO6]